MLRILNTHFTELIADMKNSEHGHGTNLNPFHIEGNIYTHTMMVYKQAITRYPDDKLLHIACLLHDIGKPYVRAVVEDPTKGTRVRFFGHEGMSVYKAIDILNSVNTKELNLTDDDKILILNTIALHGEFFDAFLDSNSIAKMENKFKSNTLLEYVQKHLICDHNGRMSLHEHDSGNIESYKATVKPDYITDTAYKPTIKLLVGPPCSGKSTYTDNINKDNKYTIISRDNELIQYGIDKFNDDNYSSIWKKLTINDQDTIDNILNNKFNTAVKNKAHIIVDMTNMSKKSRRKWLGIKSYYKEAIVFYTGYNELLIRNTNRAKTGKFIPEYVFTNMCKNFSLPMYDEVNSITTILC